jgi:hypothetical protein
VIHRIESVDALIARFTPYTGTLNTWLFCDGSYTPAGGGEGGCGGGYETYANLTATFPASAGGAPVCRRRMQTCATTSVRLHRRSR